ncbi:hypothetical protein UlMin_021123 [Ulmus minor]
MTTISLRKGNIRLPPEMNCVLYVRNLPLTSPAKRCTTSSASTERFGRFKLGRKRIHVVLPSWCTRIDIYDTKTAVDHLLGFNVANRYLIVLYYQQANMNKKFDQKKKEEEIARMQEKYGVSTKDK